MCYTEKLSFLPIFGRKKKIVLFCALHTIRRDEINGMKLIRMYLIAYISIERRWKFCLRLPQELKEQSANIWSPQTATNLILLNSHIETSGPP